jgi:hypothetical protein
LRDAVVARGYSFHPRLVARASVRSYRCTSCLRARTARFLRSVFCAFFLLPLVVLRRFPSLNCLGGTAEPTPRCCIELPFFFFEFHKESLLLRILCCTVERYIYYTQSKKCTSFFLLFNYSLRRRYLMMASPTSRMWLETYMRTPSAYTVQYLVYIFKRPSLPWVQVSSMVAVVRCRVSTGRLAHLQYMSQGCRSVAAEFAMAALMLVRFRSRPFTRRWGFGWLAAENRVGLGLSFHADFLG